MLSAGGTKHHSELLAPFGLDARDPSFWQGGLGVIERLIDELETLEKKERCGARWWRALPRKQFGERYLCSACLSARVRRRLPPSTFQSSEKMISP